jgi:hypothetical protein
MIDDLSVNSSPLWSLCSSCEFPCSYVLDSFVAAGGGEALAFDDTLAAGGAEHSQGDGRVEIAFGLGQVGRCAFISLSCAGDLVGESPDLQI